MEFSSENLLDFLDHCTSCIRNKSLDIETQERLWNSLTWDKDEPNNVELVKYLFTGWFIHEQVIKNLAASGPY